jgi:phosphatidylglycerophosphatase A
MKISKSALRHKVFSDWRYFIGFGFGSGLLPKMPGTWATLITIPLVYLLSFSPRLVYIAVCIIIFILGSWLSEILTKELGEHDYGGVNCDEILGFLIVMFPFPCTWQNLLLGFILFRAYDIFKPFPISWVDKHIESGIGMMLDDVLAAIMTIFTMILLNTWMN